MSKDLLIEFHQVFSVLQKSFGSIPIHFRSFTCLSPKCLVSVVVVFFFFDES